jgi:hypothetical protein
VAVRMESQVPRAVARIPRQLPECSQLNRFLSTELSRRRRGLAAEPRGRHLLGANDRARLCDNATGPGGFGGIPPNAPPTTAAICQRNGNPAYTYLTANAHRFLLKILNLINKFSVDLRSGNQNKGAFAVPRATLPIRKHTTGLFGNNDAGSKVPELITRTYETFH